MKTSAELGEGELRMIYQQNKAVQMLAYFTWKCQKPVSKLYLLKLVYLADRFHLRKYGRSVCGDAYYAMNYGPVATNTKKLIERGIKNDSYAAAFIKSEKVNNYENVFAVSAPDMTVFSETDREAMDAALSLLKKHGTKIVDFTHRFPEWKRFEKELTGNAKRRKMHTIDFFEAAGRAEYCDADQELVELNKEFFIEQEAICNAFSHAT